MLSRGHIATRLQDLRWINQYQRERVGGGGGGVEWINYDQSEGFVWTITMKERIKIPWTSTQRKMKGVQPLIVIMKH